VGSSPTSRNDALGLRWLPTVLGAALWLVGAPIAIAYIATENANSNYNAQWREEHPEAILQPSQILRQGGSLSDQYLISQDFYNGAHYPLHAMIALVHPDIHMSRHSPSEVVLDAANTLDSNSSAGLAAAGARDALTILTRDQAYIATLQKQCPGMTAADIRNRIQNAARHIIWNINMYRRHGYTTTRTVGDIHEFAVNTIDSMHDRYNNAIAISAAMADRSPAIDIAVELIRNGGAMVCWDDSRLSRRERCLPREP
jgi:hypothetical protein